MKFQLLGMFLRERSSLEKRSLLHLCDASYHTNCYIILEPYALSINLFPNYKILVSFKPKEFADDNSEFDENGEKFSKVSKTF